MADVVIVVNPNTGPRQQFDLNDTTVINRVKDAGAILVGDVDTDFAQRPVSGVRADLDAWRRLYPQVQGFFLDRQAAEAERVGNFMEIARSIRARVSASLIISNPGRECGREYVEAGAVDVACRFDYRLAKDGSTATWAQEYPAHRFGPLDRSVETEEPMRAWVREVTRTAGYIDVTDSTSPNPSDRLPEWWESESKEDELLSSAAGRLAEPGPAR